MRVLEAFGEPIMSGGQEAFVFGILNNMDMDGLKIDCLTPYDWENHEYRQLVEKLGGSAYELNLPFRPGKCRMNVAKPFQKFLCYHTYDIIHIHSGSISILAIMAAVADRAGVAQVIVHSHCAGEKDNLKHKLLRFMASFSMKKHVDVYCACSKIAADWKFVRQYSTKAMIIKNGIDIERFRFNAARREEYRKKLGLNVHDYVIGHVGRLSHQKNQEFLVRIFKELAEQESCCRLLLVGDGEDKNSIKALIKSFNLSEKVIMTGNVYNVQDYLQVMDVFVLPSFYEGFPIVAIEAQAAGLPIVASDTITKDIRLVDTMIFLGLQEKTSVWSDKILQLRSVKRITDPWRIKAEGYDIRDTAKVIRELYLKESIGSEK